MNRTHYAEQLRSSLDHLGRNDWNPRSLTCGRASSAHAECRHASYGHALPRSIRPFPEHGATWRTCNKQVKSSSPFAIEFGNGHFNLFRQHYRAIS